MWRWIAGGAGVVLAAIAGWLLIGGRSSSDAQPLLPAMQAQPTNAPAVVDGMPATVPEATERTREQKRFDRYDKDRNGAVTRDEYLAQRRKAYAKLDINHDGVLSFEEYAVKATTKFAAADADKSGAMNAAEFATTAVKRKPARRAPCPPVQAGQGDDG